MNLQFALAAALISSVAFASQSRADGFRCQTNEGDLDVKVYNHTGAEDGTRNVAVMIFSDPSIQYGRKTIATFTDVKGTATQKGVVYTADVDLRMRESRRSGENIAGTKLGQLDTIVLDLASDFSYASPVEEGEIVDGTLLFMKRNGEEIARQVSCTRYLKGE